LMQSAHESGARAAARQLRSHEHARRMRFREHILSLLALVEAGIDFVEEEDVRFIAPAELARQLDALLAELQAGSGESGWGGLRPHIAIVGLPNAGKSSLFNALLSHERAIVSPVLGTTRDVLSAELMLGDTPVVLQDCAGLGESEAELEAASYVATERAAQQADIVLWVHAVDAPWDLREEQACATVAPQRRVLVESKSDLPAHPAQAGSLTFAARVRSSVSQRVGLSELRSVLGEIIGRVRGAGDASQHGVDRQVTQRLRQARALAGDDAAQLPAPELVAMELREAVLLLDSASSHTVDEELLGRIFSQFCVGK
jgi:tRNA modification GTPase